jgi:hypothetical protein
LLEVMVASLLLLVVLFGLAQFYTRGRTQVDYEEYRRKATAVAQTRMDALRKDFRYEDLPGLDGADTTYVVDGRNYRVLHEVRSPVPPGSQSTEVILNVIWTLRVGASSVPDTLQTISMLGRGMP